MKVLFLYADSNGNHPVPATKGGAVATLVESLVEGNNQQQLVEMEIVSYYEKAAFEKSRDYPNIDFTWIKLPFIIRCLDDVAFYIAGKFKKAKAISYRSPFSLLWYIHQARKIVNKTDADVVVLENTVMLARILKGTKYRGKTICHLHNIPRIDAGCKDVFEEMDEYITVSDYVGGVICSEKSAIGQIDSRKVRTLYNCIDTDRFRPIDPEDGKILELKKQYKIGRDDFVLLFAGRLSWEKGADILLKAMQKLPENVKAIIVGSLSFEIDVLDEYQIQLHALAQHLHDRVIFTGFVPNDEMPYIYNLGDVAVLPSMWEEPAGLTMIEAMSCGTPVITTNAGGIPEYVGSSFILERDEHMVQNLVNAVKSLMNDKSKIRTVSKYSRDHIVARYDTKQYINNFVDLL